MIVDIAKKLLENIGFPAPDMDGEYYMIDDFIHYPIFPVYPPIGEYFGSRGSYTFKITPMNTPGHVGDYLLLRQFIEGSYQKYQTHDLARLTNPRVDAVQTPPRPTCSCRWRAKI